MVRKNDYLLSISGSDAAKCSQVHYKRWPALNSVNLAPQRNLLCKCSALRTAQIGNHFYIIMSLLKSKVIQLALLCGVASALVLDGKEATSAANFAIDSNNLARSSKAVKAGKVNPGCYIVQLGKVF